MDIDFDIYHNYGFTLRLTKGGTIQYKQVQRWSDDVGGIKNLLQYWNIKISANCFICQWSNGDNAVEWHEMI